MQEVIVMINGETIKINALRVFHWRNPKINRHGVALWKRILKSGYGCFAKMEKKLKH